MKNSSQLTVHSSQNKNIASLLKKRLPGPVLKIIRQIGKLAEKKKLSAYIVGGFVRDLLLGRDNLDLDIAIEGNALTFAGVLSAQINSKIVRHLRFGTATIVLSEGFKIDLASARKEYYVHPAALPRVCFSSIKDDLFRRDFTINTLAVRINSADFGQLLDELSGEKDILAGKIRVLHDKSFVDDPTRILRAIRFEQRYGFTIEHSTLRLMRKAIASGVLKRLSRFRLGREFILLLKEENPLKALLRFDQLCGLKLIHPLLKLDPPTLKRLKAAKNKNRDNWLTFFMLLTQRLTDGEVKKLCNDFSITKKDRKQLWLSAFYN